MKKKEYETPEMEIVEVTLESSFMKASIIEKDTDGKVTTTDQTIENDYDLSNNTWE